MVEPEIDESLSIERIKLARETLSKAAFLGGFPGAIQQDDASGIFIEAKRNLTALVMHLHGELAWEAVLRED
jgi:hypothetical protein